ncbi:MAG: hypothetical protein M1445_12760 [Bacteroidetes bacterium]|nr:hypothetical protein [Bacteroidota bacterium]MCL6101008.1 hypothetical protein [Bacteroidota bacterium]
MNKDLHAIKELMTGCAEMGAANLMKSLQPKSDDLTQNEAFEKFGQGWVRDCVKRELIKGKRKGPAKNSPIYYSKAELMSVRNAEKVARLGVFSNIVI